MIIYILFALVFIGWLFSFGLMRKARKQELKLKEMLMEQKKLSQSSSDQTKQINELFKKSGKGHLIKTGFLHKKRDTSTEASEPSENSAATETPSSSDEPQEDEPQKLSATLKKKKSIIGIAVVSVLFIGSLLGLWLIAGNNPEVKKELSELEYKASHIASEVESDATKALDKGEALVKDEIKKADPLLQDVEADAKKDLDAGEKAVESAVDKAKPLFDDVETDAKKAIDEGEKDAKAEAAKVETEAKKAIDEGEKDVKAEAEKVETEAKKAVESKADNAKTDEEKAASKQDDQSKSEKSDDAAAKNETQDSTEKKSTE